MPKTTKDFLISQIEENFRSYFLNVDDSCTRAEYVFKIIKSFLDTENKRVRLLAEDVTVVLEKDLFIDTAYVYLDRQGERILVEGLSIYYPINEYRENKKFFKEGGEIQLSRPFMDQEAFDELESKFDEAFSQGVADSWSYYSPDSYSALEDFLSAEEIKEMRSEFGFDAPAAQDEGDEETEDSSEDDEDIIVTPSDDSGTAPSITYEDLPEFKPAKSSQPNLLLIFGIVLVSLIFILAIAFHLVKRDEYF